MYEVFLHPDAQKVYITLTMQFRANLGTIVSQDFRKLE